MLFRIERRMGKKSERTEAIVCGYDDHVLRYEANGIVIVALADDERTAVIPEHHGKAAERGAYVRRGVDV